MSPVRLLILDDELLILHAFAHRLAAKYIVTTASAPAEALALWSEHLPEQRPRFDVVLTDMRMPRMSGVDFMLALHEIDADIPVILMTASAEHEVADDAVKRGAFACLVKPFRFPELERTIADAVAWRNARLAPPSGSRG